MRREKRGPYMGQRRGYHMLHDTLRGWIVPASIALGGFAAVRLICWAVCIVCG